MEKAEYQINYIDPRTGQVTPHGGFLTDWKVARKDLKKFRADFPGVTAWMKMRLVSDWCDVKEEDGSDS